jgi:hypothetical protein
MASAFAKRLDVEKTNLGLILSAAGRPSNFAGSGFFGECGIDPRVPGLPSEWFSGILERWDHTEAITYGGKPHAEAVTPRVEAYDCQG